jgi:hypothetical protein
MLTESRGNFVVVSLFYNRYCKVRRQGKDGDKLLQNQFFAHNGQKRFHEIVSVTPTNCRYNRGSHFCCPTLKGCKSQQKIKMTKRTPGIMVAVPAPV